MDTQSDIARLKAELAAQAEQLVAQAEQLVAQASTIADLERKVATLEDLVRKQIALLGRNSGNSNLPPSSDGPGTSGGPA